MKSKILLITIVAMAFFGVMAFADLDPGDNPGDVIDNPWGNLFTTAVPTESPSVEPTTEEPTQEPSTEAPTEEPSTEAPSTEEPSVEPSTEEPSVEPSTEAPVEEWISAEDRWVHRNDDGTWKVEDGKDYKGVNGISGIYSGAWGGGNISVKQNQADLSKADIDVIGAGAGEWSMQATVYTSTLDAEKAYKISLKAGEATVFEKYLSEVTEHVETIDLSNKLSTGKQTLSFEVEEIVKPDPPVVQEITITPNEAQIKNNRNIWANWTNPENTANAYVYLNEATDGNSAIASNGWDFNVQGGQPRTAVDQVNHSRNNAIKVEEGGTYTLIVESYDVWNRQTGRGEVEITIPELSPEEKEAQEYLAKINTAENFALRKTPIVGSNQDTAGNICDGNKDSRWQANKNIENTYFAVDLGEEKDIEKVLVSWEASNARAYEIYTAGADGEYGTTPVASVSDLPNNTPIARVSKGFEVSARYVKVVVTEWSDNAANYGISPYELAVFGKEVPTTPRPTQPGEIIPDKDAVVDVWTKAGDYSVYTGSWGSGTAKYGVDDKDSSHIVVQQTSTDWSQSWITQVMIQIPELTERVQAGETFTVEWPIKAINDKGKVTCSQNTEEFALTGAKQTINGGLEIKDGQASFVIGMGWVDPSNSIEFYQPTVKDKDGNIVYPPQETTTQAPSEETTTLPKPAPVIKVPDKAKITKVYKKKKSAKKLKLKIKKIKGAKGYQVAVYKSKKTAKKNKKALVKKYVKYKKKITIKSKKLKKKKKLFVKARAYVLDGKKKEFGPWSKMKKVKIKK